MSSFQIFLAVLPTLMLVLTSLALSIRHAASVRSEISDCRKKIEEFGTVIREFNISL